jgi:peptidoglycan hydrolase-like protein with peptidoglycan-binding domain
MNFKKITLVLPFVIALSACEPTTGGSFGGWPTSDQSLSRTNLVEIERNLRRLGFFRGRIDGQITRITRNAIARYQRSVGAPANGVVSARLVRRLRSSVAAIRSQPAATTQRRTTTTKKTTNKPSAPVVVPDFSEGGDSGGGDSGGGGGDGGSWG